MRKFIVPMKLHTSSYREMKAKAKPMQTKFPQVFPNLKSKAYKQMLREYNTRIGL